MRTALDHNRTRDPSLGHHDVITLPAADDEPIRFEDSNQDAIVNAAILGNGRLQSINLDRLPIDPSVAVARLAPITGLL